MVTLHERDRASTGLLAKLKWLVGARLLLASALLGSAVMLDLRERLPFHTAPLYGILGVTFGLSLAYAVALRSQWRLPLQSLVQCALDLTLVSLLVHFTGGLDSVFPFMYILVIFAAVQCAGTGRGAYGRHRERLSVRRADPGRMDPDHPSGGVRRRTRAAPVRGLRRVPGPESHGGLPGCRHLEQPSGRSAAPGRSGTGAARPRSSEPPDAAPGHRGEYQQRPHDPGPGRTRGLVQRGGRTHHRVCVCRSSGSPLAGDALRQLRSAGGVHRQPRRPTGQPVDRDRPHTAGWAPHPGRGLLLSPATRRRRGSRPGGDLPGPHRAQTGGGATPARGSSGGPRATGREYRPRGAEPVGGHQRRRGSASRGPGTGRTESGAPRNRPGGSASPQTDHRPVPRFRQAQVSAVSPLRGPAAGTKRRFACWTEAGSATPTRPGMSPKRCRTCTSWPMPTSSGKSSGIYVSTRSRRCRTAGA